MPTATPPPAAATLLERVDGLLGHAQQLPELGLVQLLGLAQIGDPLPESLGDSLLIASAENWNEEG